MAVPRRTAVPTTRSVQQTWGSPGYGYAPGFFAQTPRVPRGLAVDPMVPGNTDTLSSVLQDPGVPGQTVADFSSPVPTAADWTAPTDTGTDTTDTSSTAALSEVERARLRFLADPQYQSGLSSFNAFLQSNQNRTRDMIRQAVIGAGWDPRGNASKFGYSLGKYGDYIDEGTTQQALENPNSTRAQLAAGQAGQMRQLWNNLAARNMVRSGAAATGATRAQNSYDSAVNQQMGSLLSLIQNRGAEADTAESQAYADWARQRGEIAQRLGTQEWV